MTFPIMGFDVGPLERFTASLWALHDAGWRKLKTGVVRHPVIIGSHVVCVRIGDFAAIFDADEIDRLEKTAARAPTLPKDGRNFVAALRSAGDGARDTTEARSYAGRMI